MSRSRGLLGRLSEPLRHFFLDPAGAEVALEFSPAAVVGARVESRRGRLELRAVASVPLAEGAFLPTLEDPGFSRREEIRDAVKNVLARIGTTPSVRAALVVPDVLARFRLFTPEEAGTDLNKRDAVIAFRMRRLLPFSGSDVRVVSAFSRSPRDPALGIGFSTTVLGAYEQLGQAFGLDVGSVETSSMALLRGLKGEGDTLLLRHDCYCMTLILIRHGWPLAIRSFDASVAGNSVEARREISSTAVFWRDHLAGDGLDAVLVHASDSWFDELSGEIASGFGCVPGRMKAPAAFQVAGIPPAVQSLAVPALTLLGAGVPGR